jgi:hypothetical protein
MTDLSQVLRRARESATDWSKGHLSEALQACSTLIEHVHLDYDDFAGESWARALVGDAVVAIVHNDVPLAFLLDKHANDQLLHNLDEQGVVVVTIADFDAKEFSANASILNEVFGLEEWPTEAVNPSAFSILDLWWASL